MPYAQDQVALVTGAASGIGRATALAFARERVRVLVSDVDTQGLEETVKLIRDQGGEAALHVADISKAEEIAEVVKSGVDSWGRLDFAFNCAGVEGALATTTDCTEENWDRTLATNLKGTWLCMKYELIPMLERKAGAIVNCASVAGMAGFPYLPAYVASKHGVVGLTQGAALEYAKAGIRINAICPGVVWTPMMRRLVAAQPALEAQVLAAEPIGRFGTVDEIAASVIWLCSSAASFVTGHALAVDGGWLAQ
jgi:NAD(P)-dependent dehydrogenase (short-subunit alcohol dehydrogenase family)